MAVTCVVGVADGALGLSGPKRARGGPAHSTIFKGGFDSGNFAAWNVQLGGDATASVQSAIVGAGRLAAELAESSHPGSRVDLRKTFSARYPNLTASARFRVLKLGNSGVPLLRLFGARWNRVATVYLRNRSIDVAYGSRRFSTRGVLPLNQWGSISLHVITNEAHSTIEVWLNGRLVYHTSRARLRDAGVATVQLGNDAPGQEFAMVVDAVMVQRGAPGMPEPPVNTKLPVIAGVRQQGHRIIAIAGNWSGKQPTRYRYLWLRCDSRGGHCRQIPGATSRSYTLGAADAGRALRVAVIATNAVGRTVVRSAATGVVQSAPANIARPSIQGTPRDGLSVTANPGSWSGTQPIGYAYQWLRCDAAGNDCAPIAGATGAVYGVISADVGGALRVDVTATNAAGARTVRSSGVQPAAAPPANAAQPTILGTPQNGQTVTADPGSWSGTPSISYRYQWLRCNRGGNNCLPIADATDRAYVVASADVGGALRVDVTGTNVAGSATARSSLVLASASLPINLAPPTIHGTVQDGQTLTATPGSWTGAPTITYKYQWRRCDVSGCSPIVGATDPLYRVVSLDVGRTLVVDVTATDADGFATARSPGVQPTAAPPVNTVLPAVQGTTQSGQTLTATTGTWTGTPTITYKYQWLRCDSSGANCGRIAGATDASYLVAAADVGTTLRVIVTGTNPGGTAQATSSATAAVQAGSAVTVALWHMDETSGSTMIDSVGTHNGTLSRVTEGAPGVSGSPGDFAYQFNGSSSSVNVPSTDDLNPYNSKLTVTIHLQTTGTPPAPPADWDLIRKGVFDTGASEFKMELQQSGQPSCGFEDTALNYEELVAGGSTPIFDGQWHTIQCVRTSSAIEVIVDGRVYSQPANIASIANSDPVVIGAHPGADWYSGQLDEASIQIG